MTSVLAERAIRHVETQYATHGLAFGTRGWAYVLEGAGLIHKGQFNTVKTWLKEARQSGRLDPDAVSEDEARAADHIEKLDADDIDAIARDAQDWANYRLERYKPISVWEGLDTYVEVMVEKVDLKVLFTEVCARYDVTLVNGKGSSDINLRRRMLQRFRDQHDQGRKLVLLYCGDHDPMGLRISRVLKKNLLECKAIRDVRWDPMPISVISFGLDAVQIATLGLPWIDNLRTISGMDLGDPGHPDYDMPYVQDYLRLHGKRKVEANALAAHPQAAMDMVEAAVNRYVPQHWPDLHAARLEPHRQNARAAFIKLIKEE